MSQIDRIEFLKSQIERIQVVSQNQELNYEQVQSIHNIWKEQDKLINEHSDHLTMQEAIMDLEVIDRTGATLGRCIKSIKADTNEFSLTQFAEKLNEEYVDDNVFDWEKMAEQANPIINRAPGVSLMLGTFKPLAPFIMPERKKRSARTRDEVAEKQKPENMEMIEKNNDSIDMKVNFVVEALKKNFKKNGNNPLQLYDFILHPTDFTTTVENIFYLSFVIRDGLALLENVDDDLMISPLNRKEKNLERCEKKQMIFSINMEKWKELVNERNIIKPAINWS